MSTYHVNLLPEMLLLGSYFFFCEWLFGGTVGKIWSGLRVVGMNGQPITVWQAAIRTLFRPIDFFMFVGILSVRFTNAHQRLGDHAARTIVTGIEYLPQPLYTRRQRFLRTILFGAVILTYIAIGLCIQNGYHL